MRIEFERNRKQELSAWRKIFWSSWNSRAGWCSFLAVLLVAGGATTGYLILWICAGISLTVVIVIAFKVFFTPMVIVGREGEIIKLQASNNELSMEFDDGTVTVDWEQIHGVNEFGQFWLLDCDNGTVGSQLIPMEIVDDESVNFWRRKIAGSDEDVSQHDS